MPGKITIYITERKGWTPQAAAVLADGWGYPKPFVSITKQWLMVLVLLLQPYNLIICYIKGQHNGWYYISRILTLGCYSSWLFVKRWWSLLRQMDVWLIDRWPCWVCVSGAGFGEGCPAERPHLWSIHTWAPPQHKMAAVLYGPFLPSSMQVSSTLPDTTGTTDLHSLSVFWTVSSFE